MARTEHLSTHQYPDPTDVAYANRYPWAGGDDGYMPSDLRSQPQSSWREASPDCDESDQSEARSTRNQNYAEDLQPFRGALTFDSDYQASDANLTDDENVSDADSIDSVEPLDLLYSKEGEPFSQTTGQYTSVRLDGPATGQKRRGRGGRPRGLRGGQRGVKRGLRRPIEPTAEFKALHAQATMAFLAHSYEEAEDLILQALLINPEMYEAHNLLSEVHAARGDKDKALSAAWNGAHTRPRDPEMWSRIARLILERDDSKESLRDAVYCYNRIITVDSTNVEARYQRAALNHEIGHKKKAANEYEQLRKQLPHDTTVLRHLAEIYIELEDPDRALGYYRDTISHLQSIGSDAAESFTWSDINIVTELYAYQQRYDEGLVELKSLARWLLGRREDVFWETYTQDDREWDMDDEPRRIEISGFVPGQYDTSSYGDGLPLELRIKLGVFRLRSESRDLEEAVASATHPNHFEWLEPEDQQTGAKMYDYPDLYREAANVLRGQNYFHEALRYYEPLQQVSEYGDAHYYQELGACYRAVGLRAEAEDCFNTILEIDSRNMAARTQLAQMRREAGALQQDLQVGEALSVRQHKTRRPAGNKSAKKSTREKAPTIWSMPPMLAPRPAPQSAKKSALEKGKARDEDIQALFLRREELTEEVKMENESSKAQWMTATKALIEEFSGNKVFYPIDKHHRFYGYTKEARNLAARPKHEIDAQVERSKSILETHDGQLIQVPEEYCGIAFDVWLDIFLEYGMEVAKTGDIKSAYEVIATAFHANVFFHSSESQYLIHVCWFTCALIANDDETLCNIARWFMKNYQFVTDGYRLFAALNRLCNSENSWFNCGPSQKYILRQLKAVDFSLLGVARRKTLFQERASYTTKDSKGDPIQADDMDVALLMLYGHILYAGKSYAYAVNYFLRALALDPTNATIKLSLALGYLHYALKRQAENRHHILMQGLALLIEYYDSKQQSNSYSEKQEAEYNVGHAYHILGLTHLAIPYYEQCLELSEAVQAEMGRYNGEDFVNEAAVALQGFWAASGNVERAREVTERWMVI